MWGWNIARCRIKVAGKNDEMKGDESLVMDDNIARDEGKCGRNMPFERPWNCSLDAPKS